MCRYLNRDLPERRRSPLGIGAGLGDGWLLRYWRRGAWDELLLRSRRNSDYQYSLAVRTVTIDVEFQRDWGAFQDRLIESRLHRLVIFRTEDRTGARARTILDAPHPEIEIDSNLLQFGLSFEDIAGYLPHHVRSSVTVKEAHARMVHAGYRDGTNLSMQITLWHVHNQTIGLTTSSMPENRRPPPVPPSPPPRLEFPHRFSRYPPVYQGRSRPDFDAFDAAQTLYDAITEDAGGVMTAATRFTLGAAIEGLEEADNLFRTAAARYGYADTLARLAVQIEGVDDDRPPPPQPPFPDYAQRNFREIPLPFEKAREGYLYGRGQAERFLDSYRNEPPYRDSEAQPDDRGAVRFLYALRMRHGGVRDNNEVHRIRRALLRELDGGQSGMSHQ